MSTACLTCQSMTDSAVPLNWLPVYHWCILVTHFKLMLLLDEKKVFPTSTTQCPLLSTMPICACILGSQISPIFLSRIVTVNKYDKKTFFLEPTTMQMSIETLSNHNTILPGRHNPVLYG